MKKMFLPFLCLVLVLACAILFSSCTTVRAQGSDSNETSPGGDSAVLTNHFGQRLDEIIIDIPDSSYTIDERFNQCSSFYAGIHVPESGKAVSTWLFLYEDSTFRLEPNNFPGYTPKAIFGNYSIDGNRLILVLEDTNLKKDETFDLSALKISILINNDGSLTIIKNGTSLPGFDFEFDDDFVLTKLPQNKAN